EGQMLAIARALMSRPRFLMLDEPSLGIMPRLVDSVMESLGRLHAAEGLTMFLVEQNVPAALELATRGYVLQTGRVVLDGGGGDLLASGVGRKAYLGCWAGARGAWTIRVPQVRPGRVAGGGGVRSGGVGPPRPVRSPQACESGVWVTQHERTPPPT